MSAPVGALGAANSLASVLAGSTGLQSRFNALQQQVTTGLISQDYAGIAPHAGQVLDLQAAAARNDAYTQVIAFNQSRAAVMQSALGEMSKLGSDMAAQTLGLIDSRAPTTVGSLAQQAQRGLQQLTALLNTSYAGDYVFAGADTGHAPVPDPAGAPRSGFYTQIGAAMAGLGTTPVGDIIASSVASAASTAPGVSIFSTYLDTPAPATPAGAPGGLGAPGRRIAISDSETISLDYPANQDTNAVSDPAIAGTGSAVRDMLGSLAMLANATPQMSGTADFTALMQHVVATLNAASKTIDQQGAAIGIAQNAMTSASKSHAASQLILQNQITSLTDVDMATAISNMTAVKDQLQTSYQVLALARGLNLASML